jgi:small neutral amino acid transporter SnatA (MarC family)
MGLLTMNESSNPTAAPPQAGDQAHTRPHRFGIQNGLIYWGIVVLMASLLLWLGVELAKRIEWFLPYSGGLALCMIAGGYLLEIRKARKARPGTPNRPSSSRTGHEPSSP